MSDRIKSPRRCTKFVGRAALVIALAAGVSSQASAQTAVVNACTGLRLPRSAVTDLIAPVVNGVVAPVETRVNSILGVVAIIPLVGQVLPPLNVNASGLLTSAAAGDPLSLQVFDTGGNLIDPAGGCHVQSSSLSLAQEGGIEIGGNRVGGLGADGRTAFAGDIDAIALGNGARTEAAATASVAIGNAAEVSVANSVAIGAGSTATRGPQLAYAALALDGAQFSAGEFSVGATGAERQITHVAPGSAPTDAVNVAQLQTVANQVASLDTSVTTIATQVTSLDASVVSLDARVTTNTTNIAGHETRITALEAAGGGSGGTAPPGPVRYADAGAPILPNDGTATDEATLVGASGGPVGLHNVRAGQLAAGSTDAVNGGQLHATNVQVAQNSADIQTNTTNIQANTTRITVLENSVVGSSVSPIQYSDAATPTVPNGGAITNDVTLVGAGGAAVAVHNVADGRVAADSTDAVNGRQLHSVATVAANSVQYDAGGGSVTFGPGEGPPVALRNVAAGVAPTDAVNVAQLHSAMQSAVAEAQAYNELRFDLLGREMTDLRRDSNGGIAGALAAAALPQASDPGRGMVSMGMGAWQGQAAFAFGLSTRLDNGQAVVRAGATVDTRGRAGANAGVGIQF